MILNVDVLSLWHWLLHDQSRSLNLTRPVVVREEVQILERFFSSKLGDLRQEHLLLTHQLDVVDSVASVLHKIFLEIDGAFWVFFFVTTEYVVTWLTWFFKES